MVQNSPARNGALVGEKSRQKQREILATAGALFREQGFHRTGMRDIAQRLSMRASHLYYYFANKQALLAFSQQETVMRLLALVDWAQTLDLEEDQRLYLVVQGHVRCLHDDGTGAWAHIEVDELEEPWRSQIVERRDRYERALRGIIRRGRRAGIFRADCQEKLATLAILGACNWTAVWFQPGGSQSIRGIGRQFADQLVQGLLAPDRTLERPTQDVPGFESSSFED